MGKQIIGIQRKCLLKLMFVGFGEVVFQMLMKGPQFIYCAFDWTALDLVADPIVFSHVRTRCSVVCAYVTPAEVCVTLL